MKAVILAAGFGKRLRPLTLNRPKHVLPLAGKPLVRLTVEALGSAGVDEVGVLVGYMGEIVIDSLRDVKNPKISFIYQKEVLGTGAALKECRPFLEGEEVFYVVYGDVTVTSEILRELSEMMMHSRYDGALAAVESEDTSRFGVVEVKDGRLIRIGEKESRKGPVNAGIYIFKNDIFRALEETGFSPRGEIELTDAVNRYVAAGGVVGVKVFSGGWWFDIGNPSDYLRANMVLLQKLYDRRLYFAKNVQIGDGCVFKGPVYLGDNVSVGARCNIIGPTMVCERTVIDEDSVIMGSVILEKCYLGKKSKVSDSVICEESFFGDGVEVLSEKFPSFVSEPGFVAQKRLKVV